MHRPGGCATPPPVASAFPAWLLYSGLPARLNAKARIGAWAVFKEIVELDCERHAHPGAVEISVAELSERTGLAPATLRRTLDGLRRAKALLVFLPESDDEPALFQVRVPLETPLSLAEVAAKRPELRLLEPGANDRYARVDEEVDPEDPAIRSVVDLYFNLFSLRMNSFILDELIFIARRFPRAEIERVFRQAAHLNRPTLGWAARELSRRHAKKAPTRRPRRRERP